MRVQIPPRLLATKGLTTICWESFLVGIASCCNKPAGRWRGNGRATPMPPGFALANTTPMMYGTSYSPASRCISFESRSYVHGKPEFFQPFFILLPWKTFSGSFTLSPSTPSITV